MKSKILLGLIGLFALTFGIVFSINHSDAKVVQKMSYKPLELPGFATFNSPDFGDMITRADIIVDGKVIETKKNVKIEYVNEKGSPEDKLERKYKTVNDNDPTISTFSVMETKIKVENVIQGSPPEVITLVQPQSYDGYVPELAEGQKMVFFLKKQNDSNSRYITIHPHASFFYENESDLVYPVFQENDFAQLNNSEKKTFIEKVKKFDKKSHKSKLKINYN